MMKWTNHVAGGLAVVLALVLAGASSSLASITKQPVRIARKRGKLIVTLVPALHQAINRHFPGYEVPPITAYEPGVRKSVLMGDPPPFICVGDFDGNGLPDVVLFLKNRQNQWLLVALHQTYRGEFRPYRLARVSPLGPGLFACWITRHPPGRVQPPWAEKGEEHRWPVRSKHDWMEEEDEGATESIGYYFKEGRYRSVPL
jgi:hypothetical protein